MRPCDLTPSGAGRAPAVPTLGRGVPEGGKGVLLCYLFIKWVRQGIGDMRYAHHHSFISYQLL